MLPDRQTQGNAQRYSFSSETHKVVLGSKSTKNTITVGMLGSQNLLHKRETGHKEDTQHKHIGTMRDDTTKDRRKLRTKVSM